MGHTGSWFAVLRAPFVAALIACGSTPSAAPAQAPGGVAAPSGSAAAPVTPAAPVGGLQRFVGWYRFGPALAASIVEREGQLFATIGERPEQSLTEQAPNVFALPAPDTRLTFEADADGRIAVLSLHEDAQDRRALRVTEAALKAEADAIAQRVRDNVPDPRTEAALRKHIESVQRGEPDYEDMAPALADAVRTQPGAQRAIVELGAISAVAFKGVMPRLGVDLYEVTSEQAVSDWNVGVDQDGHLWALFFRAHLKPPATPPTREQFRSDLKEKLEQAARDGTFSGAVAIFRAGKPLFEGAYGLANRERKLDARMKTKFRIGSMNKMFTAVSVLQLVEAGKVALDDKLGKYLTDYPNMELANQVSLHQLLTHTGGAGDIFGPEYRAHREELLGLEDYVRLYGTRALAFEPGARFEYSNYGYVLLGLVIQKASGKSYYDYVRDNVYRRAGMVDSGSEPEATPVADRSVGYMRTPEGLTSNADTLPPRPTSAGGGYSTVADLQRFASALLGHRLLSAKYTELLTTGQVDANGSRYAYGFFDTDERGVRWFGHGGGAPGMNGDLRIYPGSGYVVAVLANLDPPAAQTIAEFASVRLPKP